MSKLSSHCKIAGKVFSIFLVATTLPSTFSVPVPERPTPEKLLNASVPAPRPSYLKSNSTVAGRDLVRAFPLETLKIDHVPQPNRFALQQIEPVTPETAAGGEDHALGA